MSRPVTSGAEILNESRWDSEPVEGGRGAGTGRPFEFGPRNTVDADRAFVRRKAVL